MAAHQETIDTAQTTACEKGEAFALTLICNGCNRPLELWLQPDRIPQDLRCPRCMRQLGASLRRELMLRESGGLHISPVRQTPD